MKENSSARLRVKKLGTGTCESFGLLLIILSVVGSCKLEHPSNIDQLVRARFAYQIPDSMEVGKAYKAVVTISKSLSDSVLFAGFDETKFKNEKIYISSYVKVLLIDPSSRKNFAISALSNEEQVVDSVTNTSWRWNIEPIKSGAKQLVLRVTVKIKDSVGESFRDIKVFEKSIIVKSSYSNALMEFMANNWEILLTAVVIPFAVFIFNKFKTMYGGRKRRPPIGFK